MNQKVLVIGLDGATYDLINPWVDKGRLPNIARIMKEGGYGVLRSTLPCNSAPAWSSFITGKNPGEHGIFDFTQHVPGSYEVTFVNANSRNGKSMWRILNEADRKVGIIHVPMTYPPEKVDGFMIAGMDSPGLDSNFVYPPQVYDEIKEKVGGYIIEAGLWSYIGKGQIDLAVDKQMETIEKRFQTAKYLINNKPWDFFTVVFTATDRVQHAFWKFMDPGHPLYTHGDGRRFGDVIGRVYEKLDEKIGYFMDHMDDNTTLLIMSDHGAGPSSNKTMYLNNWLCQQGLLRYKDQEGGKGSVIGSGRKGLSVKFLAKTMRNIWKRTSRKNRDKIKKLFPGFTDRMASYFFFSRIDMKRTLAYAEESRTFIWVNLKGRDPKGIVNPGDDYRRLCARIKNDLESLKDPVTGEHIVEGVYHKDDIYHGSNMAIAPDFVVQFAKNGFVPRPSYHVKPDVVLSHIPKDELEKLEVNIQANARHDPNGIVMLWGKNVKKGSVIEKAQIIDIAPTVFYLMGVPVPEDIDGKVMLDAIDRDFVKDNPVEYAERKTTEAVEDDRSGYSDDEAERIKARLKDLGYLE